MAFSDLSVPLQNIVMVNFVFLAKLIILSVLFGFCYMYKEKFKPKKDSPYIGVRALRGVIFLMCYSVLYISPLFIFTLFPQVGIDLFLKALLMVYSLVFGIGGLIVGFNVLQYGTAFALDLIDAESNFKQMQKGVDKIVGNSKR